MELTPYQLLYIQTVYACFQENFQWPTFRQVQKKHLSTHRDFRALEVAKSIEIAYQLCDLFTVYDVDMEVHADINTNPHFKSNDALKEAMGYILGMGFAFKAKPEAFASSSCANKIVN